MGKAELLLKTALCCMASDGNIAPQEVELLKNDILSKPVFESINTSELLKEYTHSISSLGIKFVNEFLHDLKVEDLNTDDALELIEIAFNTIDADNEIEYSEVAFFKKIRSCLSISDEVILARWPDKEYFILPDIMDRMSLESNFNEVNFNDLLIK